MYLNVLYVWYLLNAPSKVDIVISQMSPICPE